MLPARLVGQLVAAVVASIFGAALAVQSPPPPSTGSALPAWETPASPPALDPDASDNQLTDPAAAGAAVPGMFELLSQELVSVAVVLEPASASPAPAAPLSISALLADTPLLRQRGLQQVAQLPSGWGMLFLFDGQRQHGGFWMKETLIPLDIAFIASQPSQLGGQGPGGFVDAADGAELPEAAGEVVVAVFRMEPCLQVSCRLYDPGVPYLAALEVPAGVLEGAGIGPGSRVYRSGPRAAGS